MNDTVKIALSKASSDHLKRTYSETKSDLAAQYTNSSEVAKPEKANQEAKKAAKEIGGPKGLEPTRYGDWEAKGRCYDF